MTRQERLQRHNALGLWLPGIFHETNDYSRVGFSMLNDVIDSIRNSANGERLSPRNRSVLSDHLNRLQDYQHNHNQWKC